MGSPAARDIRNNPDRVACQAWHWILAVLPHPAPPRRRARQSSSLESRFLPFFFFCCSRIFWRSSGEASRHLSRSFWR